MLKIQEGRMAMHFYMKKPLKSMNNLWDDFGFTGIENYS